MYLVLFSRQAEKDKKLLKNAGLDKKARELLDVISENPFQNPPPYEALVGNLSGFYSRRINIQHRLVYKVYNDELNFEGEEYAGKIVVARMWTHYEKM